LEILSPLITQAQRSAYDTAAIAILDHMGCITATRGTKGLIQPQNDGKGYVVEEPPVGTTVSKLSEEAEKIIVEGKTLHYYDGTFHQKEGNAYKVVPHMAGKIVDKSPDGGKEVKVGEVHYQPPEIDGRDVWEVVKVEEGEEGDDNRVEEQMNK